ncbi:MAG: acetate kinase [Clostridia bacterium]|nr:acetate kinase [Clostridia bacterium]
MKILVLNAGSSSLKYQLIDMDTEVAISKGGCERIGLDGSFLKHKSPKGEVIIEKAMPTHKEAISLVLDTLVSNDNGVLKSMGEIDAVGHRVLHSGESFTSSIVLTDETIAICDSNSDLGPLHQKANLTGIAACRELMPTTPMVGVFDTTFHLTMPDYAYRYAIPNEYYEKYKIRRYGFHGSSHRYVSTEARKFLGNDNIKIVTCHLGNGSSMAAVKDGKCVDTSMGLTPLAGVPMGTRCGDIDCAVVEYICDKTGKDVHEVLNILNKKSGVSGLSEVSSDFRDLRKAKNDGNEKARLALDSFVYGVKKYIGSYAAAMGGIDTLVFTAGIGENDAAIREEVCTGLEFLGIEIDKEENLIRSDAPVHEITAKDGKVRVLVIPTNEELVIARDTKELVCGK